MFVQINLIYQYFIRNIKSLYTSHSSKMSSTHFLLYPRKHIPSCFPFFYTSLTRSNKFVVDSLYTLHEKLAKHFQERDSIVSLCNLCQCFITHTEKNYFLMFKKTVTETLCSSLWSLPPALAPLKRS